MRRILTKRTMNNLHKEFVQLGKERNKLTYKLLALIPEIYESGIYKAHASTIYEYAGKFGGLSKEVVKKVLRSERYLEDKPSLKAAVQKHGIHKVSMVATLATPETEKIWAERVENMSKSALQVLVKEVRSKEPTACAPICRAAEEKIKIELTGELMFEFLKLKQEFEKEKKEKLSNTEAMREIFQKLKIPSQQKAKKQQKVLPGETFSVPAKRYIPAHLKRAALAKTNKKCTYPNCQKPYQVIHHRERFVQSKSHESIIPLCKEHHEFAHNSLIQNEQEEAEKWQLQAETINLDSCDFCFQKERAKAL